MAKSKKKPGRVAENSVKTLFPPFALPSRAKLPK